MTVRLRIRLGALVALAVLIGACATGGDSTSTPVGSADPVRIGALLPMSGFGAILGEEAERGIRYYFEKELGGSIAGRPVEIFLQDDAGDANQGLTKARELVQRDAVHALIGPIFSNVSYAVRDFIAAEGIPQIYPIAGNIDESGDPRNPNMFRIASVNQIEGTVVAQPIKDLGFERVAVMAMDYVSGQLLAEGFSKEFESIGGVVTQTILTPVGSPDFVPYLSQLDPSDIDGVYAFYVGGDGVKIFDQATDLGITPDTPFFGPSLMDDLNLQELGEKALGVTALQTYASTLDTSFNRTFVAGFREKFGSDPTTYAVEGYKAAKALGTGIQAVNGNVEEVEPLVQAIQAAKFENPEGCFQFDERGLGTVPLYAFEVQKVGTVYKMVNVQFFGFINSFGFTDEPVC